MSPIAKCLLPSLAAALTLAACGSSSYSSGSSSSSAAKASASGSQSSAAAPVGDGPVASAGTSLVKTASNTTLGATVLADAKGMTLYRLGGEQNGRFICTSSSCTQVWHPLAAPTSGAPSGAVGSLATVNRPDGTVQVAYKGMPLYTFTGDQRPGDAKGEGLKDVGTWNAIKVGASGAPAAKTAPPAEPASSSGGYHY
jgi:predicted lipoprotein with Yx(FWY)xxD motif